MKKLLSLPPNLVACFHEIERADRKEWFCTSDPIGHKLGSGGGTAWLLQACKASETDEGETFAAWLSREKRILLHAGGQSRRLPAYRCSGGSGDNAWTRICCRCNYPFTSRLWSVRRIRCIR